MRAAQFRVRVASAGTGKTTVLVARYLELIGSGVPLRRIAGATFTRASAGELRQRVQAGIRELLDTGSYLGLVSLEERQRPAFEEAERELPGALLSTINGLMIRFLRLSAPALGLDPDFVLLDEDTARELFEEEFRSELLLQGREALPQTVADALQLFERRSLTEEFRAGDSASAELLQLFNAALERYRLRLAARQLGPADVEQYARRLVALPALLRRSAQRFHHVLVDEFQDVNPLQGEFFTALVDSGITVEAVGDPKQSIYGFRDADVDVFRRALKSGVRLEDLQETRRHAPAITAFLNHATAGMAADGLGFLPEEAPPVVSAGSQAEAEGSVELHWVSDDLPIAALRNQEARLLARLLSDAHAAGTAWEDMAVIARTHGSLELAQRALLNAGVPAVLASGRGFYQRQEIRDLANALRSGISARGPAFAAWLRSPFAQLGLHEVSQVLQAEDRLEALRDIDSSLAQSLARLQELARERPLAALQGVLREPLARGRRFADWLGRRQRANLDALLLGVAASPPADLELLLSRIERHARSRVAEVPEAGDGVSLVTVHTAKGLEWPLTAIFDIGRGRPPARDRLLVSRQDGSVALQGSEAFTALAAAGSELELQELYRQFYVAISRPRNRLIMTASSRRKPQVWAELLVRLGLGPGSEEPPPAGVKVQLHGYDPELGRELPERRHEAVELPAAAWTAAVFSRGRFQPVMSPSSLRREPEGAEGGGEPLQGQGQLQEPGTVVTKPAAVGTLLHAAIAYGWDPADPGLTGDLLAQEVMFPFSAAERSGIADEVQQLLAGYRAMLGSLLPSVADREHDEAELPVAISHAGTVWQGTIDRLYLASGQWWLDDYKTDVRPDPDAYLSQLAIYALAARQRLGFYPRVRLVWLRSRTLTELPAEELERALAELAQDAVPYGASGP